MNQCQIITFHISKSENKAKSRIKWKRTLTPSSKIKDTHILSFDLSPWYVCEFNTLT